MKRTFLFIVVAILLLNYSCKDEDIEYPITYTGSVFSSYNTKVYSVDGEVVDSQKINQYVTSLQLVFDSLRNLEGIKEVSITYFSPDSVAFLMKQKEDISKTMQVKLQGETIVFEDTATVNSFVPQMLNFDYLEFQPITYEEKLVPGAAGYSTASIYKPCYFVLKDGTNITMTFSDMYHLVGNNCIYYIGINNIVKEDIKKFLMENEVMVVQEYTLTLTPSEVEL